MKLKDTKTIIKVLDTEGLSAMLDLIDDIITREASYADEAGELRGFNDGYDHGFSDGYDYRVREMN